MEKLLVIFGGLSPEHDVSCLSAASLTSNVDRSRFELKCLGITREGRWLLTEATSEEIKSGEWKNREDNIAVFLSIATADDIIPGPIYGMPAYLKIP